MNKRKLQILSAPIEESYQLDMLSFVSDYALADISVKHKQERTTLAKTNLVKVSPFLFHGYVNHNKTFSSFCLGDSNQLAVAAIKRFISNEKTDYGIMYLKAESGVGKTHILHAVANEMLLNRSSFYLSSPLMMMALVDNFNKLQAYSILLIDDLEEIEGNVELQKIFCQLMDYAQSGKFKIIFTGAKNPKDLITCDERLKGKLSAALSHNISKLDQSLAAKIIHLKCQTMNLNLPEVVIDLISTRFDFNGYSLESILHKLKSTSELTRESISLEMAQLEMKIKKSPLPKDSYKEFLDKVAQAFQISFDDLISSVRRKNFALARHVAMFILKEKADLSLKHVSEIFDNDHSTVIYAVARIKRELESDLKLRKIVQDLIDARDFQN
jgi:chromosomal replication initiator protein